MGTIAAAVAFLAANPALVAAVPGAIAGVTSAVKALLAHEGTPEQDKADLRVLAGELATLAASVPQTPLPE